MKFDPSAAELRLDRLWALKANFGIERAANAAYLEEIVSDRYQFLSGMQVLRDELQLATESELSDLVACGVDMSVPTVCTTLAYTNCGDRINQVETFTTYRRIVAQRFAPMNEIGELKMEAFAPTGGGTDDGATLAHVTIAHQLDSTIRKRLYEGNAQSFVLVGVDLNTHVGRLDNRRDGTVYGRTCESAWREPRAACGAIVGCLGHYDPKNGVHQRLRRDLGEENFEYLSKQRITASNGTDITATVAAGVVVIQGMINVAHACARELDERGVAHLTASITVNRPSTEDPVLYLGRATVFQGKVLYQGLGTDAKKYSGRMVERQTESGLVLTYDGRETGGFAIRTLEPPAQLAPPHEV